MIAHMRRKHGKLAFSGFNACGDPWAGVGVVTCRTMAKIPFDAVVDVGVEFILTSDEPPKLYVISPGKTQFTEWTPGELFVAANKGWFGFTFLNQGRFL